jgi:hypothetical protein
MDRHEIIAALRERMDYADAETLTTVRFGSDGNHYWSTWGAAELIVKGAWYCDLLDGGGVHEVTWTDAWTQIGA